jgi:hypothetical protein
MATTTNFGWATPDDTDLVKDGAAAIRTLGSSVDGTVYSLDQDNVKITEFVAKGDLLGASAENTPARLAAGTNEHRLVADSGETTGLKYVADTTNYAIAAKGNLLAGTAADTLAALAVGANGTVLTADSAETTGLKWATPDSGGMTLISTTSLSGNAIALTSIPQTYNDLRIVIAGASNGTGESDVVCLRFNNNSTSNIYRRIATGVEDGTATSQANQGAQVRLSIQSINDATTNSLFVIDVPNYTSSTTTKVGFCLNSYTQGVSGTKRNEEVAFSFDNTTAITEVNLLTLNAYNWDNGTVLLYGVK